MSVFPFVAIFLILMSMISLSFFQKTEAIEYSKLTYTGYMNAQRMARSQLAEHQLSNYKPKVLHTSKPELKEKETPAQIKKKNAAAYKNFRFDNFQMENARLNICPLFRDGSPMMQKNLSDIFCRFLCLLYSQTTLFEKNATSPEMICEQLVKALTLKGKKLINEKKEEPITFSDLYPDNEELREIYYKMLRGTVNYKLLTSEGYPPLGDMVILHPQEKRKAICFKKASIPLLQASFGTKITHDILTAEEKKFYSKAKKHSSSALTKEELKELLSNSSLSGSIDDVLELLQFNFAKTLQKEIRTKDAKSKVWAFQKIQDAPMIADETDGILK